MSAHIAYVRGAYRCYLTDDGIHRRYIGCGHIVPASANKHADSLATPGEGIPATSVPPSGAAVAMPSPGATSADRRG